MRNLRFNCFSQIIDDVVHGERFDCSHNISRSFCDQFLEFLFCSLHENFVCYSIIFEVFIACLPCKLFRNWFTVFIDNTISGFVSFESSLLLEILNQCPDIVNTLTTFVNDDIESKSGFNIREIMDNKKILLVNLSKGRTGELNAQLLGMIFVMKFQAAAMSRADTPEDERQDFCLYVDEFQNFATESFESILSEARKYRLNLILANQFMTQLTDKIREAILGNVGTIMCGRIGVTDAELMEKAFRPVFTAEDLHKIPNYHAVATVLMFGLPTSPFTMRLLPSIGKRMNLWKH